MRSKNIIKARIQTDSDLDSVKSIISATTDELRAVYRPIKNHVQNEVAESIHVVAVINKNIIGAAEYIINKDNILIRNLAVSPGHRRQGAARAIIEHAILRAQHEGKTELVLSTIKETGNINTFSHMGFKADSTFISKNFEGVNGEQITQVNMSKKWHNNTPWAGLTPPFNSTDLSLLIKILSVSHSIFVASKSIF